MADTFVADISNFQGSANLPVYRSTNDRIITQVSWGTSVTSPAGRIAEIRSLNFALVIWYIGLQANEDIAAQVNTFVNAIGPLLPGETVCVDWESTQNIQPPTAAQRDQARALIAQHYGIDIRWVGTYGSTSIFEAQGMPNGWVWVASYETNEPPISHVFWQFCVDEETEALTWDGWKNYKTLKEGDLLLTLNPKTGLSEWGAAEKVSLFANDKPLVHLQSRLHSSMSTTNHRWLVRRRHQGPLTFVQTDELVGNDRIPCAAPCADIPSEAKYTDAFVELVSWYWTEGWPTSIDMGLYISQSERIHPEECDQIRRCLRELFGDPVDRNSPNSATWSEGGTEDCVKFRLSKVAANPIHAVAPDRVVSTDFIHALTQSQLLLFLETSIAADGWINGGGSRFISQSEPERLVAVELACALLGISVHITERETSYIKIDGERSKSYTLSLRKNDGTFPVGSGSKESVEHHGTVWCPTTPNGTWFARRNGTSYFTGNTNGQYTSGPYAPVNFPGIGFCDASVFHGPDASFISLVCPPTDPPNPTPSGPGVLGTNATLTSGEFIENGTLKAIMQTDGNFVLYDGSDALWSTMTASTLAGGNRVVMQSDGNLVVYTADNKPLWSSGSSGPNAFLVVQNDGNLVAYANPANGAVPIWATGTSLPKNFPTVTGATPSVTTQQTVNQQITISGTNFEQGAIVGFSSPGITVEMVTYVSSTSLQVEISVAADAQIGSSNISVMNPDRGIGSGSNLLTIEPWVSITSISPSGLNAGATNQTLTLTGSNFANHPNPIQVSIPGVTINSITYVSAMSIKINVSVPSATAAHTAAVFLTNGDGTSATTTITISKPIPPAPISSIGVGGRLIEGQALTSPNGLFKAELQSDGNFVVYDFSSPSSPKALWSNHLNNAYGPNSILVQSDGNVVAYLWNGHPLWSTGTAGTGVFLVMQNDGNLVLYTSANVPLWSSKSGKL